MITITNGTTSLTVTKGAYAAMYAPQGWEIIDKQPTDAPTFDRNDSLALTVENNEIIQTEKENATEMNSDNPVDEETTDAVDLSEIPLSEMTVAQLKEYGKQLGVEVNTDSAKTLRNRIKKIQEG